MTYKSLLITALCSIFTSICFGQMITGTWHGKINRQKVEVKIIQNGDSLTGTSYYYTSKNNFRRYAIKGYFDAQTNEVVWWDDQLLAQSGSGAPGKVPLLSRADFNCPGGGVMMLDGKTGKLEENDPRGEVDLDKVEGGIFTDEWDFVIDNFLNGGNDPWVIDSVELVAGRRPEPVRTPEPERIIVQTPVVTVPVQRETVRQQPAPEKPIVVTPIAMVPDITRKFTTREKILVQEIPVFGDSIELRFYDNAEIDGDSISLFLDEKLIFTNIRLTGNAYKVFLDVKSLPAVSELTMVAENLGTIPPNTSYMVAIVGDKRYEARLESTEGSSAMIRFIKPTTE